MHLMLNAKRFANSPILFGSAYSVTSSVSFHTFVQFVSALEGIEIEITNENFADLSRLSDEFGFDALSDKLSRFRGSAKFTVDAGRLDFAGEERGLALTDALPNEGCRVLSLVLLLVMALHLFRRSVRLDITGFISAACRPLVSIMMPTYNKGPYIRRAVLSALRQTLRHIELVIVDDCSDDETQNVVSPFISSDDRVHYFRNPTRLYTHLNRVKTLNVTRARFLLCLDSDDELMNGTAEVDLLAQRRSNADIVEHRAMIFDYLGRFGEWTPGKPSFHEGDNETLTRAFWKGKQNWNLWLKLIRRALYTCAIDFLGDDARDLKNGIGQDKLHLVTMYRFVRKFVTVDYYGYLYYMNVTENSWNRDKNRAQTLASIDALILKMSKKVITVGLPDEDA
jgi:hypothetical protein